MNIEASTEELTELCRKHRCGIENATVYLIDEADEQQDPILGDMQAHYYLDPESRLKRTFTAN